MKCPYCNQELSQCGESQDFAVDESTHRVYTDDNGRISHAYRHYAANIRVNYECDSPRGCEAVWQWSRRGNKLTCVRRPNVEVVDAP